MTHTAELRDAMAGFLGQFPWDLPRSRPLLHRPPPICALRQRHQTSRGGLAPTSTAPPADAYNTAALSRLFWMDRWHQRNGYARIFPFDPQRGAASYCAKYVTKANGDWDVSDNLAGFRMQQPALFGSSRMPRLRD